MKTDSMESFVQGKHRLTVKPKRRVEIDVRAELSENWINILRIGLDQIPEVLKILADGELFFKRIECEANKKPLSQEIKNATDRIPSLEDLMRDYGVEIKDGDYAMRLLPWTDDEGYTQFAVDLGYFPKKGKAKLLAQLGTYQVRIAREMLDRVSTASN